MTATERALFKRCGECKGSDTKLLRCTRCKVMYYCSQQHQKDHFPRHKIACNSVFKKEKIMNQEEQKLRDHPGDFSMLRDPFTHHIGHFWKIFPTRNYMQARFALVEALGKVATRDAVQSQLDHLFDMLRLCRGDNMGVRYFIPHLMLRLDLDQECYDFVRWWSVINQMSNNDIDDLSLPYLDTKDANVFESLTPICWKHAQLSFLVATILLKIKLYVDLTEIQKALRDTSSNVPTEISSKMCTATPRSPIIVEMHDMHPEEVDRRIRNLKSQITRLYKTIAQKNSHFWPALANPGGHLTARPDLYSFGSVEEMQVVLPYCYDAWPETAGATEVIQELEGGIFVTG